MLPRNEKKDFLILRSSCEEYAKDLYENGTVYMKPFLYFKQLEDVQGQQYLRGDRDEGLKKLTNFNDKLGKLWLTMTPKGQEEIKLYPSSLTLREYKDQYPLNVYCMTAVDNKQDESGNLALTSRLLEFGDHLVLFRNSQVFFDRLVAELTRLGLKYWFGHISYYNAKEYSGEITYFDKPEIFSWQSEFRFIVKHPEGLNQDLIIKLGSLKDIADLVKIER
jgi:hypothetical protein